MKPPTNLHNHHHADDLLEDYLLGTISAADALWMQAHLERCPRCRAELEPLMGAVQALPFAAHDPGVQMSDDLWNRIERSTSSQPSPTVVPDPPVSKIRLLPPTRMTARPWLMIAALIVVSLLGGAIFGAGLSQVSDNEGDAQQIAIQFTDPEITATGELRYLPEEQVFVLEVAGMPEPPSGYVYQAWLIEEGEPIPAGVMMNPETGELACVGDRDAFDTFAITIEPGPLGRPAPTSDPLLVASL